MDQYNTIYDVHTFQTLDKPANRATFFRVFQPAQHSKFSQWTLLPNLILHLFLFFPKELLS